MKLPAPIATSEAAPAPLLTPTHVAACCAVSLRTVRAWIASGRLAVLRLGPRCVRVAPEELARFLAAAKGDSW